MKKINAAILFLASMLAGMTQSVAVTRQAVVTFFYPGETGGRYNCDGNRLHRGDAAVDFGTVPKGTVLNLGGVMKVTANDCGGSAVISRKAARERHCGDAMVVDVWAPSEREAERLEELFNSKGTTEISYSPVGGPEGPVRHRAVAKTSPRHRVFGTLAHSYAYLSSKATHDLSPMRRTDRLDGVAVAFD